MAEREVLEKLVESNAKNSERIAVVETLVKGMDSKMDLHYNTIQQQVGVKVEAHDKDIIRMKRDMKWVAGIFSVLFALLVAYVESGGHARPTAKPAEQVEHVHH